MPRKRAMFPSLPCKDARPPEVSRSRSVELPGKPLDHVDSPRGHLSFAVSPSFCLKCVLLCVCVCVSAQSCMTLCDPTDCSPPGCSVHGILQAKILEWVAIPFSRGSSQPRD